MRARVWLRLVVFECEERLCCGARLKIPIARRSERMLLSQESVVALQDSDIEKNKDNTQ